MRPLILQVILQMLIQIQIVPVMAIVDVAPPIDAEDNAKTIDPLFVEARRVAAVVDASRSDSCMLQILARLEDNTGVQDGQRPHDAVVQRVAADLTACLIPGAGGAVCADRSGPISDCVEALRNDPPAWIAFTAFLATADAHVHRHSEQHRHVAALDTYREVVERLAGHLRRVEEVLARAGENTDAGVSSGGGVAAAAAVETNYRNIALAVTAIAVVLLHRTLTERTLLLRVASFLVGSAAAAVCMRVLRSNFTD